MIRKIIGYAILIGLFLGLNIGMYTSGGWVLLAILYGVYATIIGVASLVWLAIHLIQG